MVESNPVATNATPGQPNEHQPNSVSTNSSYLNTNPTDISYATSLCAFGVSSAFRELPASLTVILADTWPACSQYLTMTMQGIGGINMKISGTVNTSWQWHADNRRSTSFSFSFFAKFLWSVYVSVLSVICNEPGYASISAPEHHIQSH